MHPLTCLLFPTVMHTVHASIWSVDWVLFSNLSCSWLCSKEPLWFQGSAVFTLALILCLHSHSYCHYDASSVYIHTHTVIMMQARHKIARYSNCGYPPHVILCQIFFNSGPFSCTGLVGNYADPSHCRKYYYCNYDDADPDTVAYTCPVGYFYDKVNQTCEWATNVACKWVKCNA